MCRIKSWYIKKSRENDFLNEMLGVYDFLNGISWFLGSEASVSRKRLIKFKDKYRGKRCFIIGNGPSLNKTDLRKLKKEYTFGSNRIYLMFDKLGFTTSFLISVNNLVLEQCAGDFNKLNLPKFFTWKGRECVNFDKNTIFLRSLARSHFSKDPVKGLWEGATVTFVAMQLAYYMGFSKVILIGVDHNFKTKGKAHKAVVSEGKDPNHFDPNYFGKGFRWNLPDLETSEYAYGLAKKVFEEDGREIVDATVGGELRVFKKVKYSKFSVTFEMS